MSAASARRPTPSVVLLLETKRPEGTCWRRIALHPVDTGQEYRVFTANMVMRWAAWLTVRERSQLLCRRGDGGGQNERCKAQAQKRYTDALEVETFYLRSAGRSVPTRPGYGTAGRCSRILFPPGSGFFSSLALLSRRTLQGRGAVPVDSDGTSTRAAALGLRRSKEKRRRSCERLPFPGLGAAHSWTFLHQAPGSAGASRYFL